MRQGGAGGGLEPVQQQLLQLFNEPAAQVNDAVSVAVDRKDCWNAQLSETLECP
jgi:hypothetical protein